MNLVIISEDLQMIQPVLHDESEWTDACVYCEYYFFDIAGSSVMCVLSVFVMGVEIISQYR